MQDADSWESDVEDLRRLTAEFAGIGKIADQFARVVQAAEDAWQIAKANMDAARKVKYRNRANTKKFEEYPVETSASDETENTREFLHCNGRRNHVDNIE